MIATCNRYAVATTIGALTPTEIVTAWEAGATYVKVFPATLGGPRYLRDLLGPLPQLKLIPTGGVDQENAGEFIRAGAVAVALGSNRPRPCHHRCCRTSAATIRSVSRGESAQAARTANSQLPIAFRETPAAAHAFEMTGDAGSRPGRSRRPPHIYSSRTCPALWPGSCFRGSAGDRRDGTSHASMVRTARGGATAGNQNEA